MEVLYDLDVEAAELARELGVNMVRAETPGTHPAFVAMIRQLIQERLDPNAPRHAVGRFGPSHDTCAPTCCLPGNGRPSPWA
jgi:ferrochelatase